MRLTVSLNLAVLSWIVASCSNDVDVGHNGEQARKRYEKTDQTAAEVDEEAQLNGQGNQSVSGGSCFSTDESMIPETVTTFCAEILPEQREQFDRIYQDVCIEKKYMNLFHPKCGWSGTGAQAPYLKILDITDLESEEKSFYYYVVYGITLEKSEIRYQDLIFEAYSNPEEFQRKHNISSTTRITPTSTVEEVGGTRELNYEVEMVSSLSSMVFNSRMKGYDVEPEGGGNPLEVVFDWTDPELGQMVGIKMRKNLTFAIRLPDGTGKVIVFEERDVKDMGKHHIALGKMQRHDFDKMDLLHKIASQ